MQSPMDSQDMDLDISPDDGVSFPDDLLLDIIVTDRQSLGSFAPVKCQKYRVSRSMLSSETSRSQVVYAVLAKMNAIPECYYRRGNALESEVVREIQITLGSCLILDQNRASDVSLHLTLHESFVHHYMTVNGRIVQKPQHGESMKDLERDVEYSLAELDEAQKNLEKMKGFHHQLLNLDDHCRRTSRIKNSLLRIRRSIRQSETGNGNGNGSAQGGVAIQPRIDI